MHLAIYIHGETESGFLDLDPGSSLSMEELTPPFDEELSTGEYSLPYDGILWTENNRRLLKHAEQLNNATPNNVFVASVYADGDLEIVRGKLTLLTKQGNLNYRRGKFTASISGSKGMYGTVTKNKKLKDLTLGGRISWEGGSSRLFAQGIMDELPPQYWYLSFVPVAIETFIDQNRADYTGEFIAKDCVNNLVTQMDSTLVFGRPSSADPFVPAAAGTEEYMDYRTVPFYRVIFVLRQCFEEFGFRVDGDFINDPFFYNLLLFNNFAIERYDIATFTDINRSISPENHVPDLLISDFLKGLCGAYGIFPVFGADNSVNLVFKKRNIAEKKIKNIDDIVASNFDSTYLEGVATSGYKLNYQWDSADSYYSDRVKDISLKTLCATVNLLADLFTLDIGRPFTTDDIVLVEAENMYYQVADATTTPVLKWDAWAERMHPYIDGDGEESKDAMISTLCQYVEFNSSTGLLERRNYLGCRQEGSYINHKGTLVKKDFGFRIFYGGNVPIGGIPRPMSYNHSRRPDNNSYLEKYSLAWLGDEGLAKNFHIAWQNSIRNKEEVQLFVLATPKDLAEIRAANTIELQSMHFVLKRIERSIPLPAGELSVLYVIPL